MTPLYIIDDAPPTALLGHNAGDHGSRLAEPVAPIAVEKSRPERASSFVFDHGRSERAGDRVRRLRSRDTTEPVAGKANVPGCLIAISDTTIVNYAEHSAEAAVPAVGAGTQSGQSP
jgi:hypothetical protein